MNQAELENIPSAGRRVWPWIVAGVVLFLGVLYLVSRPRARIVAPRTEVVEDSLGQGRQELVHEAELTTCRSALQQFNTHLGRNPDLVAEIKPLPREELAKLLGLNDDEWKEIQGTSFTALDGRYLEQCFLFRDAARWQQEASTVPGTQWSLLERATAGFRWTMRQVRLEEPNYDSFQAAPPSFVLRRGWGSALERGLVFLALLQQMAPPDQLQGCLVYCPGNSGDSPRLWACGVIVKGESAVYLFDPRLGLPIPGANPGEVATLGQVRKSPSLVAPLTVNEKNRYDVTAEQADKADLRLVCPLSGMAPRLQLLQDRLLGPTYQVRLFVAPLDELQRLKKAAQTELGRDERVLAWLERAQNKELDGPGLLRRFLAPDEGGSDLNPLVRRREFQFYQSMLRWTTIPEPFGDSRKFPPNSELGARILLAFRQPLLEAINDPKKPRNLILRGRFSKVTPTLVEEQRMIRDLVDQRQKAGDLSGELNLWLERMNRMYADQARASNNPALLSQINQQIQASWTGARALLLLLAAATAEPRTAQVGYLLGLCKQEQAEIQQARLDLQTRANQSADASETRNSWLDALSAWDRFLDEHPRDPASGAARQLRARALAGLGRWQEAAAAWENLAPPLTPLEQVAGLYLAQQIRKQHEKK